MIKSKRTMPVMLEISVKVKVFNPNTGKYKNEMHENRTYFKEARKSVEYDMIQIGIEASEEDGYQKPFIYFSDVELSNNTYPSNEQKINYA